MKRFISIFLFAVYFLGATEAYQLLKLPLLVQHYKTHQKMEKGVSVTKFINVHYFQPQPFDSDYQQDMQLPFKTSNRDISLTNYETLFVARVTLINTVFFENTNEYSSFDDNKHASINLGNIFQPPRV